jgi:alpha-tubulin suppressor-like RCC1 family protein
MAPQAPQGFAPASQGYDQSATGYSYPSAPPPKKGVPTSVIIIAIVVVVALIGAAVWYLVSKPDANDPGTNPTVHNAPSVPGSAIAWGQTDFYQVTPETYDDFSVGPTAVPETDGAVLIAATSSATYFVKTDGTLWGWGGYLGSQRATAERPVQIGEWTNVIDVVGFKYSDSMLVLLADGSVYAMGQNEYGEVGTGTPTTSSIYTPNKVAVSNVVAIAAGDKTGYALDSSGAVWAWGSNESAELGIGNYSEKFAVVQVQGLPKIASIGGGGGSGYAIDTTGTLWVWGANGDGQLGLGNNNDQPTPVKTEITDAIFVDGGKSTTFVIRSNNSLWATGHGSYGELGNGSLKSSNTFVASLITNCRDVSMLWRSAVAVDGNGDVFVFGNNWDNRLGLNSDADGIGTPTKNGVTNATRVAAAWWHSAALVVK